jgi:hypothetical protein
MAASSDDDTVNGARTAPPMSIACVAPSSGRVKLLRT